MNQSDFIAEVEMLGINVTSEKMEKLEKYYELIIQYNKIMNLTSITEKRDVYLKHFYDSLTISKIINFRGNCMKAAFYTLGCKVNQYETEYIAELLKNAGFEIVSASEKADYYIVNSCTVTSTADQKTRQNIRKFKRT